MESHERADVLGGGQRRVCNRFLCRLAVRYVFGALGVCDVGGGLMEFLEVVALALFALCIYQIGTMTDEKEEDKK